MRSVEGEPAVVLRRTEYGESDLILSLYGRSLGKVDARARAARRSRKRFGAALGLFTVCEVALSRKGESSLWTLQTAEPRVTFANLALDITCMAHGSYGTELVRELSAEEDPDAGVFDLLVGLYHSLESDGPLAGRLRVFELRLLAALGLAPVLDECASCSGPLEQGSHLDPSRGGVVCASCSANSTGYGVRGISSDAIELLQEASRLRDLEDGDVLDRLPGATEARQAMLALLYFHVGKPLKSVEFIAKLRAGH